MITQDYSYQMYNCHLQVQMFILEIHKTLVYFHAPSIKTNQNQPVHSDLDLPS